MYKRQILFCCLAQLTIVMSATTSSIDILADTTPKSTVAGQCLYNGQLYNEGDIYNSIDDCNTCSCGWYGTTCTLLFCPNTHATTTPSSNISPDLTSTTATSTTSSTISPDTSSTTTSTTSSTISPDTSTTPTDGQCAYHDLVYKDWDDFIANYHCQSSCFCIGSQMICAMCTPQTSTPGQCIYNGQVYNDGENFIANDYCQSSCWCMGSQMICKTCPPQTSISTPSTIISSEATYSTTSAPSSSISPDTTTTTRQCIYNGQVYNDGENFITNDYCQSSCWCMGSQMICTMCPPQTSTSTTSSTISPDTSTTPASTTSSTISSDTSTTPTSTTSSTISPDTSTTTTSTSFSSRIPTMTSTSSYKKKRRRTTLQQGLYTKTMKFHTDVFDAITKKPHFTTHDSRQFGSKRTAIPKGNRKNVDKR